MLYSPDMAKELPKGLSPHFSGDTQEPSIYDQLEKERKLGPLGMRMMTYASRRLLPFDSRLAGQETALKTLVRVWEWAEKPRWEARIGRFGYPFEKYRALAQRLPPLDWAYDGYDEAAGRLLRKFKTTDMPFVN